MNIKRYILFFFSFLSFLCSFSQNVFYQDIFYGGVTAGGFSTGLGVGSGTFNLYIEPGSTIKKAYLFTYRIGYPPDAPIIINTIPYLFDTTNTIMDVNYSHPYASPIKLYYYDFTNDLNSNITSTFNITIPSKAGLPINWGYWTVFIYIAYENPSLTKITSSILINDKNFVGNEFYNCNNLSPINTSNPVGFSLYTDRTGSSIFLNERSHNVYFNTNLLGIVGGTDNVNNLWAGSSVKGHFYYQNNQLFGLDDDTPDAIMDSTDGLADVSSYLSNNVTSCNFQLTHKNYPNQPNTYNNINLSFFLTYTTPCDTFSTNANSNVDTICQGESIQLNATGGVEYSWFSAFSTFNDSTLANPIASPTQTTTYIVTIKNDSGCVKTEHVKVWVNPAPKPDTIVVAPQRCGSANGSITVGNIPNGTAPFNYELVNLQTLNTINQATTVFSNLQFGTYQLSIQDSNGCQWQSDTLVINEINDITANFSVYALPVVIPTPNPLGTAPLTVYTQNSSVNATSFEWWVVSDVLGIRDTIEQIPASAGMTTPSFNFDSGGTFEVCLLAYNNIPTCGDTVCKTIVIAPAPDSLVLIVPNVFSPNADGSNDNFVLQVQSANLLEKIEVEIFNRWGMIVESREFKMESTLPTTHYTLWDGTTTTGTEVPEGTYFYVINYTKVTGETESLKGTITLLR